MGQIRLVPASLQSEEWSIEDACLVGKQKTYIVSVIEELFDVLSVYIFANKFNERATRLARYRTSFGKSRICLLGVDEHGTRDLKRIRRE